MSVLTGIELLRRERARQIRDEGWGIDHDMQHPRGELAMAGASYAANAGASLVAESHSDPGPPAWWPWETAAWKPKDPLRDLVRAGALIAAEIDQLLLAGHKLDI